MRGLKAHVRVCSMLFFVSLSVGICLNRMEPLLYANNYLSFRVCVNGDDVEGGECISSLLSLRRLSV